MSLPPIGPNQKQPQITPLGKKPVREEAVTKNKRRVFSFGGFKYLSQLRKRLVARIRVSLRRRKIESQSNPAGYIPDSKGGMRSAGKGAILGRGFEGQVFRAIPERQTHDQSPFFTRTSVLKEAHLEDTTTSGGIYRLNRAKYEAAMQKVYPDAPKVFSDEQTSEYKAVADVDEEYFRVIMEDAGTGLNVMIHGKTQIDQETGKVSFQLKGQNLDETTFQDIGGQLSRTLQKAHKMGIAHRDIKPENMMLSNQGKARIIDFGMSIASPEAPGGARVFEGVAGTSEYMPPEMMKSEPYSLKADVWSLGLSFAEMLTGKRPGFQKLVLNSTGQVGEKVVDEQKREEYIQTVTQDPSLSENIKKLLSGMLEVNPDKRLSAEEVASHPAFKSVSDSEPSYLALQTEHREKLVRLKQLEGKSETDLSPAIAELEADLKQLQAQMDKLNDRSQEYSLRNRLDKLQQDERVEKASLRRLNQEIANLHDEDDEDEVLAEGAVEEKSSEELITRKEKVERSIELKTLEIQKLESLLKPVGDEAKPLGKGPDEKH
ncbi:hypothetical protein EOPP23_00400 [Endozoicomonas sp. OPT23]|uniref:protein kinase domain-containing protein n=1 Tax=Endozoicomonas sp. OPT23 TaxID=2072845 RepID=UPI00129A8A69|nr:protein kinase [Endozoicomonas sp. OPT23]MRI31449.1 hypothetical protein [Endozoicomonas sp. OPT23]